MKHVIESQQFDQKTIRELFALADSFGEKNDTSLRGKIMATLFYEPSTRTRFSFEAAMLRLGGHVISTENAGEFSSAVKGESLEDTIRIIGQYADVIVLRHPEINASERAAAVSDIPVINAGDGAGQHPTQALLDLYTIEKKLKKINGIKIAFVGDLKHGRTVRSLAYLLGKYKGIEILFISPVQLRIGEDIKGYLKRHGISYHELRNWGNVLKEVDVLYQTRIQKERFKTTQEYNKFKGSYALRQQDVKIMKKGAIIMHPLPRLDEISFEVDNLPQAAYFKQAGYGLPVRMALLKLLLS